MATLAALRNLTSAHAAEPALIWTAANDGAGSGLDADLLDGYQASAFAQLAGTHLITGAWNFGTAPLIGGNVVWHGNNDGAGSGLDADLLDGYQASAFAQLGGTHLITGAWNFGTAPLIAGNVVWHGNNDGAGSGLDADLLDGLQATAFAQLGQPQTITGLWNYTTAPTIGGVPVVTTTGTQTLSNKTIIGGTSTAAPGNLTTTSGALVAADANCAGTLTGNITLPSGVFAAQRIQVLDAGASARTITRGSGLAMYVNGVDVASATLGANKSMGVFWRSGTECVLSGGVVAP
jgi:hypothetical protein